MLVSKVRELSVQPLQILLERWMYSLKGRLNYFQVVRFILGIRREVSVVCPVLQLRLPGGVILLLLKPSICEVQKREKEHFELDETCWPLRDIMARRLDFRWRTAMQAI